MSIVVTGANGFVGRAVVDRLPGARRLVRGSLDSPREAAMAIEGAHTIIHLAARLRGAPADVFRDTVVASNNLIEAALAMRAPPRIVLTSSLAVYGVASLRRNTIIDETTPIESAPRRRDLYAQAKLRQEKLFRDRYENLVVVRPGVVFGPGGTLLSTRVGLQVPGLFLFLGGDNRLPLTFVENCADAIVAVALRGVQGETYNIIDDDLPTAREYLSRYRERTKLRHLPVPYPLLWLGADLLERYSTWSRGQLPAILTPYKVASMHKGMRYANAKLKTLSWQPRISMDEAIGRTLEAA
ncbi:MAG TPA: NAD(P)-dependent oxidoreductase [Polyangiaceae bacterium]|nr:NAD(P)-dependent oxidoreductase [Polyangiaceae bacterium]